MLHSGHAADGRVKRVSTQLSHLPEQNAGQNYLSGNNNNEKKKERRIREKLPSLLRELLIKMAPLVSSMTDAKKKPHPWQKY